MGSEGTTNETLLECKAQGDAMFKELSYLLEELNTRLNDTSELLNDLEKKCSTSLSSAPAGAAASEAVDKEAP